MTTFRIDADGLGQAEAGLRKFVAELTDLRPFWSRLGRALADDTQSRWPLRRRSGRLWRSLIWTGNRLGRGSIYRARQDRLTFGTHVFYSSYHQRGAKHLPVRQLVRVDPDDIAGRLDGWAIERARAAGFFEVS